MSVRVAILGQGLVATHFEVGLERFKAGEIGAHGVPLADSILPYKPEDIDVVVAYDVDEKKIGRNAYEVARDLLDDGREIPRTLKDIDVRMGIHMETLKGTPFKAKGLDDEMNVEEAVDTLIDEWRSRRVDVVVNVITTEHGEPLGTAEAFREAVAGGGANLSASHIYAYALAEYSTRHGSAAFVNAIPTPLANDDGVLELYGQNRAVVFGDDGATGATPLTADLLEHMAERNRKVGFIVQFNIGGNTDFLALTLPEKNAMKELTKSSIVDDILGYDAPHYIKPTGYLKPLGDKKFVAMHMDYLSFNGARDELYVFARINDSPALAGLLVDLVRLAKVAVIKGQWGTIYPVNAFYMKRPGPPGYRSIAKNVGYELLKRWVSGDIVDLTEFHGTPFVESSS